jgi:transcriptional regulator with PAS, ATPase and Fis domain
MNKQVQGFSQAAIERLSSYNYPGNVRELENLIERALALAGSDMVISLDLLPEKVQGNARTQEPVAARRGLLKDAVDVIERRMLTEALERCAGNKTQAAQELGLSRMGFQKKLKRHRLG